MIEKHETFKSLYWKAFMAGLAPGWDLFVLYLGTLMGVALGGPAGAFLGTAALVLFLFFDWRTTRREFMELLPDGFLNKLVPIFITGAGDILEEAEQALYEGTYAIHRSWFIRRWAGRLIGSLMGVFLAYQVSLLSTLAHAHQGSLVALITTGIAWIQGAHLQAFFLARKIAR